MGSSIFVVHNRRNFLWRSPGLWLAVCIYKAQGKIRRRNHKRHNGSKGKKALYYFCASCSYPCNRLVCKRCCRNLLYRGRKPSNVRACFKSDKQPDDSNDFNFIHCACRYLWNHNKQMRTKNASSYNPWNNRNRDCYNNRSQRGIRNEPQRLDCFCRSLHSGSFSCSSVDYASAARLPFKLFALRHDACCTCRNFSQCI